MNTVDLGRALKAPFEDREWISKTLLGWLWALLIVTSPALLGASVQYVRSVAYGNEQLPDWSGFGDKWVKGFLVGVAGFLYVLPVIALAMFMSIPAAIFGAASDNGTSGMLTAMASGSACIFSLVAIAYSIAVSILFYAAMVNFAMKDRFGAFFEVGEILALVRNNSQYWMAWLFAIVISLIASAITWVLAITVIGGILWGAVYYLQLIWTAHIFGQWARGAFRLPAVAPAAPMPPQAPYPPQQPYAPQQPYPPQAQPAPQPPAPVAPEPPAPAPAPQPAAPPAPAPAATPPTAPAAQPPEPAAPAQPPTAPGDAWQPEEPTQE